MNEGMPSGDAWTLPLTRDSARVLSSVAWQVANRLADPGLVQAAVRAAVGQTAFPRAVYWEPHGVAQGDAGLAIMCQYLDACFAGQGWNVVGHEYLSRAARCAARAEHLSIGMFSGLAGLAFAAWSLSRNGAHYQRLLTEVDAALVPRAVAAARQLTQQRHGVSVGTYDLISGLSGVGAYLLCRRDSPQGADALREVLTALITLTGEQDGLPRWHTPFTALADEAMARDYPNGNLNLGLAHGIAGPLALMALSLRDGPKVEGLRDAVAHVAGWLASHRADDPWGVGWPSVITLPPIAGSGATSTPRPSRTAWCYGTPGVARALWMAGVALDDPDLCALAVDGMTSVYRRPLPNRGINSPTFCHGIAGLLQVTLRFAHDTGDPIFAAAAVSLSEQLLELYQPNRLLGYASLEPGGQQVDQPGLLDGAPGVVLVLLAASCAVKPTWDRLFLLA